MDQNEFQILLDGKVEDRVAERLLVRLMRPCWPGGPADRTMPPATVDWLRKHGPARTTPVTLDCTCATTGRCRLCN